MKNMTKQQVIETVKNSVSSIFSKEDVIKLIESVQGAEEQICIVLEQLKSNIEKGIKKLEATEIVDFDSVQLSINYSREIEIDDMTIKKDSILDVIEEEIDEVVSNYEEEQITEQENEIAQSNN